MQGKVSILVVVRARLKNSVIQDNCSTSLGKLGNAEQFPA